MVWAAEGQLFRKTAVTASGNLQGSYPLLDS